MKTKRFGWFGVLAVSLTLAGAPGCDESSSSNGGKTDASMGGGDAGGANGAKNIVDTAVAAGTFNTLAKALTDTGLDKALSGAGPFTVFAPTDDAFAKLPAGTLDKLTKDQLADILKYHVVGAKVLAKDVKAGPVSMLNGISAFLATDGGVTINGAKVTATDVLASNGVIHVIDAVLLPPNLVQAATFAGAFKTLVKAVGDAGLADALSAADANLTVFAPTDDAFKKLPAGTVEGLTKDQLASVLKYHVVAGKILAKDLKAGDVTTLNGKTVAIKVTGGVTVNDAKVVIADVVTTNGIIHAIDTVLIPQ